MRSANNHLREHIAREAARIMVAGGSRDFQAAKRKAAERLGVPRGQLPRNDEVEAALLDYLQLFQGPSRPEVLGHLRRVARDAMYRLAPFHPFLVGPVLSGTADENSEVQIHVFHEPSEDVGRHLEEHGTKPRSGQRRFHFAGDEIRVCPTYRFLLRECPVEVAVLCYRDRANPPLSAVDGRPMRRASRARVEELAAS